MSEKDQVEEKQELAEEKKEESPLQKVEKKEKGVKRYQRIGILLFLLLLVLWVLLFLVVGITHMPNGDMSPRIDAGDLILFWRLDKNAKYQDVIVFTKDTKEQKNQVFVSRVIGKPGDTIEITESGRVKVNGDTLVEVRIFYDTIPYEDYTEYPLTLGEDEYFVLADYRKDGTDSRYFGTVKKSEINGIVITILRRSNI